MVTMGTLAMSFDEEFQQYIRYLDERRRDDPWTAIRRLFEERRFSSSFWVVRQLNLWGQETMTRGKGSQKPARSTDKQGWTTFVEISLAGHTREAIQDALPDFETVYNHAADMLQAGYRVGFTYNSANDAFTVSVTCRDEGNVNEGLTFTSFAGDWYAALQVALYKHYIVAGENWKSVSTVRQGQAFG